jgi:ABC-type sugar transport system permease subunit
MFGEYNYGQAAAMGLILFFALLALTVLYAFTTRKLQRSY